MKLDIKINQNKYDFLLIQNTKTQQFSHLNYVACVRLRYKRSRFGKDTAP